MSFAGLLSRTAVVVTMEPGTPDEYEDPILAEVSRRSYAAYLEPLVAPGARPEEDFVGRDTLISDWRLILPAEAVVTGLDRIELEGKTYEVIGEPWSAHSPRGSHQVELRVRLMEGG